MNAKYAVIRNNFVENLIVCAAEQVEEMEAALEATLMEAAPLGMEIGDYYNGTAWTRNVDGVQTPLPIGDNPYVAQVLEILGGGAKTMWMSEMQKAKLSAYRAAMDAAVENAREDAAAFNKVAVMARSWTPGAYAIGDVRLYDDIPYKCVQAHDSTQNPAWTPSATPALWMQYHGTSPETARAWVQPTGAHDMYKSGEYMVWTDGSTYKCVQNTAYSPGEYAQAWEAVE